MAKKNADDVVRRFTTMLPVRLTDRELLEKGKALALARGDYETHEHEESEARRSGRERATELEREVTRLARLVRDRQELREVLVEVRLSDKAGFVDEVRSDSGEILQTRKMAEGEAQRDFLETPVEFSSGAVDESEVDR